MEPTMNRLPLNPHEQLRELTLRTGGSAWYISEDPSSARGVYPAGVTVTRYVKGRHVESDPNAHWMNKDQNGIGDKFFTQLHVRREDDQWKTDHKKSWEATRAKAIAWATEQFGPQELKKSKMRAWVPVDCIDIPTDRQRMQLEVLPLPCSSCGKTVEKLSQAFDWNLWERTVTCKECAA